MATVNPYLIFNGNCEEAFLFYKSVFGGEFPYIGKFKDMPEGEEGCTGASEKDADRIMHVSLPIGDTILMGSDSSEQSGDVVVGGNFSVSINVASTEEADRIFNGLSAGGAVYMPMEKTFWGAYFGMFKDKFDISWMVNFDENMPSK
ncbi:MULTISPECIES: VOC family protein [Flavobacterium]|jgi:PhnB protein|uniref:VOC family protein n=1 Tax=Flavobacterium cupriresistens TaxID=2893885 RepID=A0ABU4R8U3_9FLAO|nr:MULTISPECIES: VOC family protein [unclassified Flavobacterium]KLT71755.1 glyoxalase [Flavobacterium sp. ABG]MDX6188993.1 VOC family protein [Flavobacterium sp. Fl-318]UFH44226.1 VOC family protein [Flavobacterium sp. F-323]